MSSQVSSPYYSKTRRVTAYMLLFIQLFLPVSATFPAVVQAAEAPDFTVRDHYYFSPPAFSGEERDPPAPYGNLVHQDDILSTLPTLGLPKTEGEKNASPEVQVAQGASQAGRLLSNGDARDASIEYARSLGENLINQQITDWMNQYGKARVQLSTDKIGDADLLLPLIDKTNSLVFSQVGIRANEYRNTINLGVGYRQYQADWMWGGNSFYDYDLTGGNSRMGVGSELWFDYFKFAGNGYFRLTDWHQSDLHAMRDYDERPANGFDLRAEGYLPSYPQLGAYAKYEQYFGKKINLSNSSVSVGDLKDNPSRSTLGLSYTPFPLMTLKGETSRGDLNDSRIGLELTYRFGVPLNQQLDPKYVDSMRNLAGNRYDFVDRNYNIVMQYRKQELLTISLPDSMSAEAAALLPVVATVNKSKYGLKSIAWSAPELVAQGGKIQITSPTTINLTLPANVFQTRANKPQSYRVSAVGTDNEGNTSNMAVMWVNVKPSQEIVTSLTLSPNTVLLANNSDTYTATALIKNEIGESLVNKDVTFTVSGFTDNEKVILTDGNGDTGQTVVVKTDINGQALITIKSKIAGNGVLKASIKDGSFRNTTLRFAADMSTAQIATLVLTNDKALANGKATNVAVATVQDQFGNVVEGFELASSASNGAMVGTQSQATNAQGQVTISFTNFAAGSSVLTVSGTGTQKNVTAQFIADISTAKIASVVVDNDNAVANGQDRNVVTVTVVDGNGNVLANAPVTITVPNSGKYSTLPANGLTNSQGQLVVYYTNTKAGTENYSVSINNSQDMAVLAFVGDVTTARVVSIEFDGTLTEKIANGMNTFKFTAKVEDAKGNPVKDILVAWSKTTGASLLPMLPGTMTDTNGLASVELTSTTTIDLNILVSAQVGATEKINANTKVSFIADKDTATIS
ncbi:TPA: inverse autotransporter beta domain-containing protein, partial [Providencia alcalifaciens]